MVRVLVFGVGRVFLVLPRGGHHVKEYDDGHCTMTDEDSETGYKAFEIEKGRLSFRLTAPYSEERRRAASDYAKKLQILCSKVIEKNETVLL